MGTGALAALITPVAVVYVVLGLLAAPVTLRRLGRYARGDDRPAARLLRSFSGSPVGRVVAVLAWPLLAAAVELGFLLGWWDWRGSRS